MQGSSSLNKFLKANKHMEDQGEMSKQGKSVKILKKKWRSFGQLLKRRGKMKAEEVGQEAVIDTRGGKVKVVKKVKKRKVKRRQSVGKRVRRLRQMMVAKLMVLDLMLLQVLKSRRKLQTEKSPRKENWRRRKQ